MTTTRPHTNHHELRVIGMSRSGNHAIINWITAQATGRWCFLNCAEGKMNPYLTARAMDHGRAYETNIPRFNLRDEQDGRHARKDLLVISHEDAFLRHACSDIYEEHHDEWVGPSQHRRDVLILRDPFNLFASRLRSGGEGLVHHIAARIWKQHARAFLKPRGRLRHDPLCINYNRWCDDRDYRLELAEALDLQPTDAGRNDVSACAGGSSFDGLRYNGRADRMNVHMRWKHYCDDERYRSVFDADMVALSEQIFGEVADVDAILAEEATSA